MKPCTHTSWLKLTDSGVVDTGRFSRVIRELYAPERQTPSLVTFIGRREKDDALRKIFPHNNFKRAREDGSLQIRIETDSMNSENPLLVADGPLYTTCGSEMARHSCHDEITYPITWPRANSQEAVNNIFARVILPLCNVVCLFVDRFIETHHLLPLVQCWASLGKSTFANVPTFVRPQVLLISSDRCIYKKIQETLAKIERIEDIDTFASVSSAFIDPSILSEARYHDLKAEILERVEDGVSMRRYENWLFSASHVRALYYASLKLATESTLRTFDPVKEARRYYPELDLVYHLGNFLSAARNCIPYEEAASHMASALLMDAYPPNSHKFDPNLIFQKLYKRACQQAFSKAYDVELFVNGQCRSVQDCFCRLYQSLETGQKSSSGVHLATSKSRCTAWISLKNNRTCLFCLLRSPEHVLSCGHSMCETCIRIFGKGSIGSEHQFDIRSCMFCGPKGTLTAKLKPPSAGIRMLGIDGGGARGVIPLEVVSLLQEGLGPNCLIQDFFDLAIGTSSGLFLYRWSTKKCTEVFTNAVKCFFPGKPQQLGWRLRGLLNGLIRDSMYDWKMLEQCLQDSFGCDRCLFDGSNSRQSGIKLAVTATSIADASIFLFANYNASDTRKPQCGYESFRPVESSNEARVWEAARATTAAPLYFRPAAVSHLGFFQDGGLGANNPISLLQAESRHIWPDASVDVVISLGTGTEDSPRKTADYRNSILDGFIPRSIRYLFRSIEGEKDAKAMSNRLEEQDREKYFRFNVTLKEQYPLDDILHMDELQESVRVQKRMPQVRRKALLMLLASSFFFELSGVPQFENGFYRCEGSIRCRANAPQVCKSLTKLVPLPIEFVLDSGHIARFGGLDDICGWCRRYNKQVTFYVRHPSEVVAICMRMEEGTLMKLSGFPRSLDWFVASQMLDSDFGNPHHDSPEALRCSNCGGSKQKRKSEQQGGHYGNKRLRV